jgi:hypothetical protein
MQIMRSIQSYAESVIYARNVGAKIGEWGRISVQPSNHVSLLCIHVSLAASLGGQSNAFVEL